MNLEIRADTRIKENLKKYQDRLLRLQKLNAEEPPTQKAAMGMLCHVFGHDLTHVFCLHVDTNGRFCDAATKEDKKFFCMLECKRIGTPKKDFPNYLHQVIKYCTALNVTWGILTNGAFWQLFYVDVKATPATATLVWEFDVLALSHRQAAHRKMLLPLCRESLVNYLKE